MIIKGSAFHVYMLMLTIGMVGLILLLFGIINFITLLIAEGFIIFLIFIFSGLRFFYYEISDNQLIVKNLFFWWYYYAFPVDLIDIIVIYMRPDGNRIVRINNKRFISNNLRNYDLELLVNKLRSLNIKVEENLN
jgi:hypothetical protein